MDIWTFFLIFAGVAVGIPLARGVYLYFVVGVEFSDAFTFGDSDGGDGGGGGD